MAVLRDANGTGAEFASGAGPNDYTGLTIGNQSNLALVVQIVWGDSGVPGTVTVTWDYGASNQSCTLIKHQASTGNRAASLYGLVNPAQGNKTLRVTHSNSIGLIVNATSYYNVDQTGGVTTFPNSTQNTGAAGTASVSITSTSGNRSISCWTGYPGGSESPTILFYLSGSGAQDGGAIEGSGTGTETHSADSNEVWAIVGTDIKAFAATATATVTGTATASITEADVVTGGKEIIITLTGDTFIA
jgi:hypothetical protein